MPSTDPLVTATPWATTPQFTQCHVGGNSTGTAGVGGGVYVEGPISPSFGVSGVFFNHGFIVDNKADSGGGVYVKDGVLFLNNSVLNTNEAKQSSVKGGLGGGAAAVGGESLVRVWFCTVYGNRAVQSGGGIYIEAAAPRRGDVRITTVTVDSSILWADPSEGGGVAQSIHRSLKYPSSVVVNDPVVPGGVDADPRSAYIDTVNPECLPKADQPDGITYVLSDGSGSQRVSPCKNKAGRSVAYNATSFRFLPWPTDIRGRSRMIGVAPDMGAYEIQSP